ncbi:unnamed protein product [Haemonchus placei]|uniref:Reverse transcriptase domain-containing protein n=1 Tax=Haemonchus placei TaxID=6290 RepID=A0A0N4WCK9_HAEPC|nr:unnamed protein product [Haemonchus placei]
MSDIRLDTPGINIKLVPLLLTLDVITSEFQNGLFETILYADYIALIGEQRRTLGEAAEMAESTGGQWAPAGNLWFSINGCSTFH